MGCYALTSDLDNLSERNLHLWRHEQFNSQTAPTLLRSSPAYGRSTSCRAWQPDRWPDLLGNSMAMGWNHPGARGSAGSSGNHGDSAGSSSRGHPDGYPARCRFLSAEDTGLCRVTITHMTNASTPEARAEREEEEVWIDESASLVGQKNICKIQTRVKRSELISVKMQSCTMLDDCDKEIKIAVRMN